jgi:toxin ParE1/3/4
MRGRRRPITWSRHARADLAQIWNYHAKVAGRPAADNIVREINSACRLIENHPFGGRARDEVRPGLRSISARSYIVFYRVRDSTAEIVRILHGRRDLDEIFADDPDPK